MREIFRQGEVMNRLPGCFIVAGGKLCNGLLVSLFSVVQLLRLSLLVSLLVRQQVLQVWYRCLFRCLAIVAYELSTTPSPAKGTD